MNVFTRPEKQRTPCQRNYPACEQQKEASIANPINICYEIEHDPLREHHGVKIGKGPGSFAVRGWTEFDVRSQKIDIILSSEEEL